jgi:hypothetical protein
MTMMTRKRRRALSERKPDEREYAVNAETVARALAALLNEARNLGLSVSLDSNEYDIHTVWYGQGLPFSGQWDVSRSGDGSGPYVAERVVIGDGTASPSTTYAGVTYCPADELERKSDES